MNTRLLTLCVVVLTSCNRPQKSCTVDNNNRHLCIEWRGYSSEELSRMVCPDGKIDEGRECSREGAIGYCIVREGKHENHDYSYAKVHDPASCASPNVWVPLP